jgi:hypothetical protein
VEGGKDTCKYQHLFLFFSFLPLSHIRLSHIKSSQVSFLFFASSSSSSSSVYVCGRRRRGSCNLVTLSKVFVVVLNWWFIARVATILLVCLGLDTL